MYNADNYRKVKEEYNLKRANAIANAEARKAEIHSVSPEIKMIDAALAATGIKLFAATLSRESVPEKIEELKKENLALQEDKREILRMLGYPADYTEVKYECDKCKDTGYVDTRMCDCMRHRIIKEGFMSSGLGYLIEEQSFDSINVSYYGEYEREMKNMIDWLKEYAKNFSMSSENLLFVGGTGLGKTHVASAIAKEVIEKGYDVFYESASNIVSDFEYEKFRGGKEGVRTDRYFDSDLLIIDDLGSELSGQFAVTCFYNIINTRMNRKKPTIISTNLGEEDLNEKYEARISSRIVGKYIPCLFKGNDIRIHKT